MSSARATGHCHQTNKASSPAVAHKRTPASAWKDALRRSCLERARNHRRRSSGSPGAAAPAAVGDVGVSSPCHNSSWLPVVRYNGAPSPLPASHPPLQPWTAQQTVEQTLQHWGVKVSVKSPSKDRGIPESHRDATSSTPSVLVLDGEYCMTEEEWFELLQDVEDELKRAEEAHLDEHLEDEQRYVDEQVADYERWQHERHYDDPSLGPIVVCPLCRDAPLAQTPDGSLACPNRMDESCAFRLEARPGLTLTSLRQSLAAAFDEHAAAWSSSSSPSSKGCQTPLQFEAVPGPEGGTSLWAYCASCRGSKLVV